MESNRPTKRPRTSHGNVYHDEVPFVQDVDYNVVHASEGILRRVGNDFCGARMQRDSHPAAGIWENTADWSPPDDPNFALDADSDLYDTVLCGGVMDETPSTEPVATTSSKKKSTVSKRPHVVWMNLHRQVYLNEIVRWAGRGDFRTAKHCPDCMSRCAESLGSPEYRCKECFQPDLVCKSCCVKRHRVHPLHVIKKWTGSRFVKISLKDMGLTVQLNHSSMFCENSIPCHANMLILHTNGIHSIAVQYCGCSRAIPHHIQLLRRRLYPASQISVKTCATFELLRHLHKMALTTKASTYDFYRCLDKLTDGTGIDPPKSRYRALFRMIMQWRHLQMLKWAGIQNEDGGIAAIRPGQLAVRCPSCPHPGMNLANGWENAPSEIKIRFLYMMIVCMDANFRLKNQLVSNYSQDPGLGIGWAYMVPRKPYEEYILRHVNDEDISTCVGFQALAKKNNKFNVGLRYTGANITVCGRSEMILPLGVGNLQKGERYTNMDYIFGSTLQFVMVNLVLISYDIMCQWFINLFKRIDEQWPAHIKPRPEIKFIPAIPKLHEPMHNTPGHEVFSLNFIKGCGHTDCECVERVWSSHNALANATKTQGPGSRQDILDDHFGFWNWEKYISMGSTLLRRYKGAVRERNLQMEGHRGLTASLDQDLVSSWEKMCVEWDDDSFPKTKKNPYHLDATGDSEAQAKKELADEEAKYLEGGGTFLHATTPSAFIGMGLDLEAAQHRIRRLARSTATTSTLRKDGDLTEQRNALLSRIRAWEQLLPIYVPGLLQYHSDHPPADRTSSNAEDTPLWLPSRFSEPHRSKICAPGLPAIEERLRDAQLPDALENVKKILKIKSRMISFKNKNIRGQRDGTRSRSVIDRVHDRARYSADKYREARVAKYALAGPGDWEQSFRVLEDNDIRGYQDPNRLRPCVGRRGVLEDDQLDGTQGVSNNQTDEFTLLNDTRKHRDGTGETRRTLSWIWLTTLSSNAEDGKDDILQSEWARSRARVLRGKEEVMILKEEMRRVLAFLDWKARWWRAREGVKSGVSKDLAEGLTSYAHGQAALQEELSTHFRRLWKSPLQEAMSLADGIGGDRDTGLNVATAADTSNDDDDDDVDDECDEYNSADDI
ncbi:hypothetical protein BDN70DRAFT_901798 [Pholiota conissans]|uniref:CxC2-like cysteine cluster KDZ transposase-associated domain-containing protein n=1 Tax=Pholiota conissans TaxID=109636 RepID=A0A9P6CSR6_9AGAR|nr:hypothetical protein BDN70DRAFT_901798 [Pholiota conissans]